MLKDGRTLGCDLFLVVVDIRSETGLAKESGLDVARGLVVDDLMQTSDPLIFAVGDVAEYNNKTLGLWTVAVSRAEVAAVNAVGGDKR